MAERTAKPQLNDALWAVVAPPVPPHRPKKASDNHWNQKPPGSGMEDQLGALGLVVNVMVLWTRLYRDRAL